MILIARIESIVEVKEISIQRRRAILVDFLGLSHLTRVADGRLSRCLFLFAHPEKWSDVSVRHWCFFYLFCLWIATCVSAQLGTRTNKTRLSSKENDHVFIEENPISETGKTARRQQIGYYKTVVWCKWRHEYSQQVLSFLFRLSWWDHRRTRECLLRAWENKDYVSWPLCFPHCHSGTFALAFVSSPSIWHRSKRFAFHRFIELLDLQS